MVGLESGLTRMMKVLGLEVGVEVVRVRKRRRRDKVREGAIFGSLCVRECEWFGSEASLKRMEREGECVR